MKYFLPSLLAAMVAMIVIDAHGYEIDIKFTELRYCGKPKRNADGVIIRSTSVKAQFKKFHPCPSTGLNSGACSGWAVDHIIPLVSCGCDSVINMQWLPNEIKSGAGILPKDRWEQKVYKCKGIE